MRPYANGSEKFHLTPGIFTHRRIATQAMAVTSNQM
jgi:hypothetical protein